MMREMRINKGNITKCSEIWKPLQQASAFCFANPFLFWIMGSIRRLVLGQFINRKVLVHFPHKDVTKDFCT